MYPIDYPFDNQNNNIDTNKKKLEYHDTLSIRKTTVKRWNITVREPLKSKLEVALHFQCNTNHVVLESMKQNCLTIVRLNMFGKLHLHLKHSIYLASFVK